MAKTRRRRCDYCGDQYRYARATSKTCSGACRQALHEQRMAEESANEQPQVEPNGGRYMQLAGRLDQHRKPSTEAQPREKPKSHEEELDELMEIVMPGGRITKSSPPAPVAQDDAGVHVTINNIPTRFPGTPLSRGRQG